MQRPPPHGYNGPNFYLLRNLTFPMVLRQFTSGRVLLMLGLIAAALSGCGQKGSLYLPDQPPPHLQSQSDCRTPTCAAVAESAADDEAAPGEQLADSPESNVNNQEDENTEPTREENTAEETTE